MNGIICYTKPIFLVFMLFFAGSSLAQKIQGSAFDLKTQKKLYKEERMRTENGKQRVSDTVNYYLPNGSLLATKKILYKTPLKPEFTLIQFNPYFRVQVKVANNKAIIDMIREGDTTRKEVTIPNDCIIDAGFDALIAQKRFELSQGKAIEFPMLVPEFGRVFTMRLEKEQSTEKTLTVKLKVANRLIAFFADEIRAEYSMLDGKLLKYYGVSDLKDAENENFEVKIQY